MDFSSCAVLCIGDVMLDRYVYGAVDRISPEAPVPVLRHKRTADMLGGAGNVARNVASLGGRAVLVGLIGQDKSGYAVQDLASNTPGLTPAFAMTDTRPTICKTRFIADQQQLIRFDDEINADIRHSDEERIFLIVQSRIGESDVVILSDYGKGLLTESLTRRLIQVARQANKPIFVDPKVSDYSRYSGATCITPNIKELTAASRLQLKDEASVVSAAELVMRQAEAAAILVTRSEKGMTLVESDGQATTVPARAREVFDVSGAGDTVIATLALVYATGRPLREAMYFANAAAGVVVSKLGTATATIEEIYHELDDVEESVGPKARAVMTAEETASLVRGWKAQGLAVGFTNGCFDVVHAGHVALLSAARARCDRLVVALNTDASVSRLKGSARPINALADRAQVMRAFRYVDAVTCFDEDTPLELIAALVPDVLIKGGDYTPEQVVGRDVVLANGGAVHIVPTLIGRSTTSTIGKFRQTA